MSFHIEFLLVTALVMIRSAAACSKQTCALSETSRETQEMKRKLAEAISLTNEVAQSLNDAEQKTCNHRPEDCEAVYKCGSTTSGVYTVWPRNRIFTTLVQVYCDMTTDGGGWTVIQRRGNFGNPVDYFFRGWKSYKEGFGDITEDFWIGNDLICAFTNQMAYSLRFDLMDLDGQSRWALYDTFWIDSEAYNYTLAVRGYSGNAGDSFTYHNGQHFAAKDSANDGRYCAQLYKGAWWYRGCHRSNLNGLYLNGPHSSDADGIEWATWRGYRYSLPFTEMKIRSTSFKPYNTELQNEISS